MEEIEQLVLQLSNYENELKNAEQTIQGLNEEKIIIISQNENPNIIKEENESLKLIHQVNLSDIKDYQNEVLYLQNELKNNQTKIIKLKEENENLKKRLSKFENKDNISNNNRIKNIKDLKKTIKLDIYKNNNHNHNIIINVKENKKYTIDTAKKKEYENILNNLKLQSNEYILNINEQNQKIKEYIDYLNKIYNDITSIRENINNNYIRDDNIDKILEQINTQFNQCSLIFTELEDISCQNINYFQNEFENILSEIRLNIENFDKNEYQNENSIHNIYTNINNKIIEIKKVFENFNKIKNKFESHNNNVGREFKKLKELHELIDDYNKNIKQNNINNNIIKNDNNINNNKNNNNININNDNIRPVINIKQSILFNVKNKESKLNLYKTINLFKKNNNKQNNPGNFGLIKQDYHEICYIYDNYDLYDIYFNLKAFGMNYNKANFYFQYSKSIEIQSFQINDIPSNYQIKNLYVSYDVNLRDGESKKIHIIYKLKPKNNFLTKSVISKNKIYRKEYYGLDSSLAGISAKFSLILKGNYDIVNFEPFFLIRNTNNLSDVEYIWGGVVPDNGKKSLLMLSKIEAKISFKNIENFSSSTNISGTAFSVPIRFLGGNNEIIDINPHSPQTNIIKMDEEKKRYVAEYYDSQYNKAEFIIEGTLINKCKGEWYVDLTDEEVIDLMPEEDKANKGQLKTIAKKIIEEFDKENKNNDFVFSDFQKIGFWVKKNIKYDINLSGAHQYFGMDIYNMRRGVCHHFTILSNALLYSLGYKVLYVTGTVIKRGANTDLKSLHAWSLVKINNKWYPFDSTWGILTGKLPVGHVFRNFGNPVEKFDTYNGYTSYGQRILEVKFIES